MNTQTIKEILSTKIFENMNDQSAADVLREVLFINNPFKSSNEYWNIVFNIMLKHMPELKTEYKNN